MNIDLISRNDIRAVIYIKICLSRVIPSRRNRYISVIGCGTVAIGISYVPIAEAGHHMISVMYFIKYFAIRILFISAANSISIEQQDKRIAAVYTRLYRSIIQTSAALQRSEIAAQSLARAIRLHTALKAVFGYTRGASAHIGI